MNSTIQGTTDPAGSISLGPIPKWMLIVYHLPFLLQVSLLHPKFYRGQLTAYQAPIRFLRLLLTPLNIWLAVEMKRKFRFLPFAQRGPANLQFACWVIHLAMRSIEWGLVSTSKDDPTFQLRPEFVPSTSPHSNQEQRKLDDKPGKSSHLVSNSHSSASLKDVFFWSFHQLTSLRGINYNWGWKGRNQVIPSLIDTLRLALGTHILQTIGLVGCVLSRDHGTPKSAMLSIGVPDVVGLELIAEILSTLCWGILCSFGMEFGFCLLALSSHLMSFLDRFVVRLPTGWMAWWDLRLFVPLFHDPLGAQSLASLWGLRWHQIYRRSFIFLGAQPASNLARKVNLSFQTQRIFGLFGSFLVSAILHEIAITFVAGPTPRSGYNWTDKFPGSIFYFLIQPIGILIEPYVIRWIPHSLGGGRLWVLAFTLLTARAFKDQYLIQDRVVDNLYPPLKEWPLTGFLWPPSIMRW